MPLPSSHEITQNEPNVYHVTGTIDAHGAAELATSRAELLANVVSLTRTDGGGIAYDIAITADYSKADAADAAAKAKAEADAKAAQDAAASQAEADKAAAAKAQDDADARLASTVAAAVAGAIAAKS